MSTRKINDRHHPSDGAGCVCRFAARAACFFARACKYEVDLKTFITDCSRDSPW